MRLSGAWPTPGENVSADVGLSGLSEGSPDYPGWPIEYQLKADVLMLAQSAAT